MSNNTCKMRYFTLFSKKNWPFWQISEVTVLKDQYFLNKKYRPLAVLRKKANDSLLQACQI
jgi:hypothetical protein